MQGVGGHRVGVAGLEGDDAQRRAGDNSPARASPDLPGMTTTSGTRRDSCPRTGLREHCASRVARALDAVLVARAQRVRTPFMRRDDDDFEVVASVEQVQPGSPLDAILRREQTLSCSSSCALPSVPPDQSTSRLFACAIRRSSVSTTGSSSGQSFPGGHTSAPSARSYNATASRPLCAFG